MNPTYPFLGPVKMRDIALQAQQRQKQRLIARRAKLDREFVEVTRAIQDLCDHDFVWEQVAGEGQTCLKCGLRDYSND